MKKKIAGILMIVLSIGALGFWELWGRENISYRTAAVLKDTCEAHTIITEDMLKPKKVETLSKGAIPWKKAGDIVGLETRQYVAGDQELHPEYFGEPELRIGKQFNKYVLSIPETWLMSVPESIKRGDKAFFYLGKKLICETSVIHVKDSYSQEVTYSDMDRFCPSGRVSEIEVIVSAGQMKKLDLLASKGNRFTLIYTEEAGDD